MPSLDLCGHPQGIRKIECLHVRLTWPWFQHDGFATSFPAKPEDSCISAVRYRVATASGRCRRGRFHRVVNRVVG